MAMTHTYKFQLGPDHVIIQLQWGAMKSVAFIDTRDGDGSIEVASSADFTSFVTTTNINTQRGYRHRQDLPIGAAALEDVYQRFTASDVVADITVVSPYEITVINPGGYTPACP